ncbi:type VI secretion system protein ImpM [Cribrihabitans marinus]|uniref:Type VI secretion system protein ImpM n=1 Tax=Cribrihabitans marinus TaxID=1227549 RepID=A0A1H7DV57_9RHOB|nr:type VI secretion system-associated protein TagF [Cribrihabitans marinus]SEK03190.1 type VI secretion system protein ImpM [Cribrihabitans marinus]
MSAAAFGAFGKMPCLGDFFRLDLPAGFVQAWDGWVQRSLLAGREAAGSGWDALYLSCPIWRFGLSAGLAGPQKMLGVMMPSVDRVGRQFPLTLAAPLSSEGSVLADHLRSADLFAQLEELALAALEDDMTRDRLAAGLAGIAVPARRDAAVLRAAGPNLVMTQGEPTALLPDLAAGLLAGRHAAPSIWTAWVAGVPRLLVCDGLPEGPNVQGLFDLTAAIWTEARPV